MFANITEINEDNADQYHVDRFCNKQFEDTKWYSNSSDIDRDDDIDDYWDDDNDSWDNDDTDWDSD